MDDHTRLLTLAHLHMGKTPTEASDAVPDCSYTGALKLKKALMAAEDSSTVLDLFNLEEAALEVLMESVKKQLMPAIEAFGVGELVEEQTKELTKSIHGGQQLNIEFQSAASELANKIKQAAVISNNADTVLSLAKALVELQNSFFGQGAMGAGSASSSVLDFERYLKK